MKIYGSVPGFCDFFGVLSVDAGLLIQDLLYIYKQSALRFFCKNYRAPADRLFMIYLFGADYLKPYSGTMRLSFPFRLCNTGLRIFVAGHGKK